MVLLDEFEESWLTVATSTRFCLFSAGLVGKTDFELGKVVGEARKKSVNLGRGWEFFNHFECKLENGGGFCPWIEMVDDK